MVLTVRGLATMAALLLAAASPSRAYMVRSGEIYEVPEADRVSAKQLFARDADVVSLGLPHVKILLSVPGLVYIRHIENKTAVAAGLFGRLRASGNTRGAIEYATFPEPGESPSRDAEDTLRITSPLATGWTANQSEVLLLDIELYQKNALRQLDSYGSADIVIMEDVLSGAPDDKTATKDTILRANRLWRSMMPGNLFVSDPTARLRTTWLDLSAEGFSTVQLDVASLNSTKNDMFVSAQPTCNVTLFASEFVSPIRMDVTTEYGGRSPRNPLCVATKGDVKLTLLGSAYKKSPDTVIPGGSTCVKVPLPPREPSLVANRTGETSADFKEVQVPVFPPEATPPPTTTTPTSSSRASFAASSPVLTVLLPLFLFW